MQIEVFISTLVCFSIIRILNSISAMVRNESVIFITVAPVGVVSRTNTQHVNL